MDHELRPPADMEHDLSGHCLTCGEHRLPLIGGFCSKDCEDRHLAWEARREHERPRNWCRNCGDELSRSSLFCGEACAREYHGYPELEADDEEAG